MNFARDVVDAAPPARRALVALGRDGARASGASARWPMPPRARRARWPLAGSARGDVVMTLVGNRPEWVLAMLACFRIGAVVLPCTEQLRPADLRARLGDRRSRGWSCATSATSACSARRRPDAEVLVVPGPELTAAEPLPAVELEPEDPCLVTFTSGTAGEPKAVLHGQRYLIGQHVQAEHWLGAAAGAPVLVHRRLGLVEVRAQRLHRPVAAGRRRAAARRALRPPRTAGDPRRRGRRHALHGARPNTA